MYVPRGDMSDLLTAIHLEHQSLSRELLRVQGELTKLQETRFGSEGDRNTVSIAIQTNRTVENVRKVSFTDDTMDGSYAESGYHTSEGSQDAVGAVQSHHVASSEKRKKERRRSILTSMTVEALTDMEKVKSSLDKYRADTADLDGERRGIRFFVRSDGFLVICAFLTLSNAVYMGIETNAKVQHEFHVHFGQTPTDNGGNWKVGGFIFNLIFMLEVIVRIAGERILFIFGRDSLWNYFDILVIIAAFVEAGFEFADEPAPAVIIIIRTFRAVRIVRCLRLQYLTRYSVFSKFARNLKAMVFSLTLSTTSFCSSVVLLSFVMYIFSLILMQGLPKYLHDSFTDANVVKILDKHYGSLDKALWSLLCAVTGGIDWSIIADPLKEIGLTYTLMFMIYVFVVLLGLLNILNGVFVGVAMQAAETNRDLAVDRVLGERQSLMAGMIEMFIEADTDHSGTISWPEFQWYFQDDRVKAYFTALGLSTSSLLQLFNFLDVNSTGEIGLTEFVEGCFRMRGPARVVDMTSLQESGKKHMDYLETMVLRIDHIDKKLKAIDKHMQAARGTMRSNSFHAMSSDTRATTSSGGGSPAMRATTSSGRDYKSQVSSTAAQQLSSLSKALAEQMPETRTTSPKHGFSSGSVQQLFYIREKGLLQKIDGTYMDDDMSSDSCSPMPSPMASPRSQPSTPSKKVLFGSSCSGQDSTNVALVSASALQGEFRDSYKSLDSQTPVWVAPVKPSPVGQTSV